MNVVLKEKCSSEVPVTQILRQYHNHTAEVAGMQRFFLNTIQLDTAYNKYL